LDEVKNAKKYFPAYSNSFVDTIKRKEGKGTKFHFLYHFLQNITIFGRAGNVFGGIGEHSMKPNVKDPARRTQYQENQEFCILFKQYEHLLLHTASIELNRKDGSSGIINPEEKLKTVKHNRLGYRIKCKVDNGQVTLKDTSRQWKGLVSENDICEILKGFGDKYGFLH